MILGREPVAIAGVVAIAINLAISFGLNLTVEQVALVNTLVVGLLALLARSQTTSLAHPNLTEGTAVTVVTPAGQGASNPLDSRLITLSKYELCGHCFGSKAEIGGALGKYEVPAKPRRRRTRGVTAVE